MTELFKFANEHPVLFAVLVVVIFSWTPIKVVKVNHYTCEHIKKDENNS